MRRPRSTRRRDAGAALVEFALLLTPLTLFLFGIIQFGIAFDKNQSINSAAREGARSAAIPVTTVADIQNAVENSFQGLVDGTVTVTVTVGASTFSTGTDMPCDGNEGQSVVVLAEVPHTITIPLWGTKDVVLDGRGEFRCERAS